MSEFNIHPFVLDRALAGDTVVTKNGHLVTDLHLFKGIKSRQCLAGVLSGAVHFWQEYSGWFLEPGGGLHENDLFLGTPKPKTVQATTPKEPIPDLGCYAGRMVFIEAKPKADGTPTSNYNNGEYFCVRNTPGVLYGVKLTVGYGGHELKKFNLIGTSEAYKVLQSYSDGGAAQEFATRQEAWSQAPARKEQLQWMESVYSCASETARAVKQALAFRKQTV